MTDDRERTLIVEALYDDLIEKTARLNKELISAIGGDEGSLSDYPELYEAYRGTKEAVDVYMTTQPTMNAKHPAEPAEV